MAIIIPFPTPKFEMKSAPACGDYLKVTLQLGLKNDDCYKSNPCSNSAGVLFIILGFTIVVRPSLPT